MIRITQNPPGDTWDMLCRRPGDLADDIENAVRAIIDKVRQEGDKALWHYSAKFGGPASGNIAVGRDDIEKAGLLVPAELRKAIAIATGNIRKFHEAQLGARVVTETSRGVMCWRKSVPVQKVGLYIPGGSAPLFSTLLMLGVPAKIAGCRQIVVCTPPRPDGSIAPEILYCAGLLDLKMIFKTGGAQAIAAMAYGTESIPKVDKIFGPGNRYVTKAKELVLAGGQAIDMPAGPSEVLVIADEYADPSFVAADLLSQAEHGEDSQVVLLSPSAGLLLETVAETERQLALLPRRTTAEASLRSARFILLTSLEECMDFSNLYAPEHLIINCKDAASLAESVENAGSVFIGPWSCESAGDYASGTNHTLPTNGFARSYSGLSVQSFMKDISFQEISAEGIRNLGPVIEKMAAAESLEAHRNAVTLRLKSLENG